MHLFGARVGSLSAIPRSAWLSAAGGISVAYVFVHLLPELAEREGSVAREAEGLVPYVEDHVYLVALVGFAAFYGVEVASRRSRDERVEMGNEDRTSNVVFSFSMGLFVLYNAIIGYLLAREEFDLRELVLFSVGLGLHFVVNDFSLREHHKHLYDRLGRFVVVAGIVAGWLIGRAASLSEAAIGILLAFIAGGVVLNVIKEELPKERRSRFSAFALAAAGYAALLAA